MGSWKHNIMYSDLSNTSYNKTHTFINRFYLSHYKRLTVKNCLQNCDFNSKKCYWLPIESSKPIDFVLAIDLFGRTVVDVSCNDFPTVKIHSDHRMLHTETWPNTPCFTRIAHCYRTPIIRLVITRYANRPVTRRC